MKERVTPCSLIKGHRCTTLLTVLNRTILLCLQPITIFYQKPSNASLICHKWMFYAQWLCPVHAVSEDNSIFSSK